MPTLYFGLPTLKFILSENRTRNSQSRCALNQLQRRLRALPLRYRLVLLRECSHLRVLASLVFPSLFPLCSHTICLFLESRPSLLFLLFSPSQNLLLPLTLLLLALPTGGGGMRGKRKRGRETTLRRTRRKVPRDGLL